MHWTPTGSVPMDHDDETYTKLLLFSPYRFIHLPFSLYTTLSIPFCSYHFVQYHFVQYHFVQYHFVHTILSSTIVSSHRPTEALKVNKIERATIKELSPTVDEVWMVAALAQLHHRIHQIRGIRRRPALREEREVALKYRSVVLLLNVRQFHFDDCLLLWRQALLDVLLQAPQHHRLQKLATRKHRISNTLIIIFSFNAQTDRPQNDYNYNYSMNG